MENSAHRAIAIVGVGAILPDAPNAPQFWNNIKAGRYSISDVTPDRWNPEFYYDADPAAPDKTYSKIGGWVREYAWDPMKWKLPVPPRVAEAMDPAQKWAVACTREALEDYGYPKRPLDLDRTAVILGNAMAGEKHYLTSLRVFFPEYAHELAETEAFANLPESVREQITKQFHDRMAQHIQPITEDSMPGELANCMAGRIANLYNFHGPNFVCDAACASAMAAITAAVEGLVQNEFDVAVTGGVDRNMGAPTFVKFCKIGALSATGTRPYAQGADGFVMGEGAAMFILKRLADAERDSDRVYAVLRGIGGASDGKGKGITAPNPLGQKLCVERAWQNAGLPPATATLVEGHGTSTRVGDVVEAQSMVDVLSSASLPMHSVALGSVKSNIGHLKGAAGAAGILKTAFALRDKVLPPSLHCEHPSPDIDFAHSPLYVNTELKPWNVPSDVVRRAGVSAFGFGGTNFHVVMEEHIPGKLNGNGKKSIAVPVTPPAVAKEVAVQAATVVAPTAPTASVVGKAPLRGALVLGAESETALIGRLKSVLKAAQAGEAPAPAKPGESELRATERIAIDYADAAELAAKSTVALKAFEANNPAFWKALRAQGIFRGHGPAAKVAFLYTGQGSQYVNMTRAIRDAEPIVAETFAEADRIMTPLLGKPLTEFIFVDPKDANAVAKAEDDLRQTAITQPAVLTTDLAMTRLLAAYGIEPDMTMGHSVGEYGALAASGALPFEDALEAVSARGREMSRVTVADKGKMAAVFAPITEVEKILKTVNDYVVIANINSTGQSVIGGATKAVEKATEVFLKAGFNVVELPVSHAFHTSIVAPASEPLRQMLKRLRLRSPQIPIIANLTGEFYATGPDVAPQMGDILAQQVAAPVQFVKGLRTLYDAGARVFVEVGPKKALQGFAEDVLGSNGDVLSLFTNHPKLDDLTAFNQALCGLYAFGFGLEKTDVQHEILEKPAVAATVTPVASIESDSEPPVTVTIEPARPSKGDRYTELEKIFGEAIDRARQFDKREEPKAKTEPVVITGASLGLPGTKNVFDDANVGRILRGDQLIGLIPERFRQAMVAKHVTRLVKSDNGGPTFESITNVADVIKLAGRGGELDLEAEFGVSSERVAALDRVTQLAIASGLEAMRDAGIPLVMRYKTTTKGTQLRDRWGLPGALRDDTGVIFASAFPGYDAFAEYLSGFYTDRARHEQLALLEELFSQAQKQNGHSPLGQQISQRIESLRATLEKEPYVFDRKFLFRVLSMGHSQFAEFIGARGPNTQINAACASTSQAIAMAQDWIRAGRCTRVIVVSADDATSDNLMEWIGTGFLASGAAATDEIVEEAAIPFDRRRHGLIVGMGAAALIVESAEAARERGIQPICEVLSAVTANSAFHGSRLDVQHIGQVMEDLVSQAETQCGISRYEIAPKTVFVSHETYTPARGGSASAEIFALRRVFGDAADQIVIANTKGFTGHAMGTGIEEVVAVKALETGQVPPVANFKEIDPELGSLNLSKGGSYPVEYALRLGAGFGSQISTTLLRWVKTKDGIRRKPDALGYGYRIADANVWNSWLSNITGYPKTELEVVKKTLRVCDQGPQSRVTPAARGPQAVEVLAPAQPVVASVPASAVVAETKPTPAVVEPIRPAEVAPVVTAPTTAASAPAPQTSSVRDRILELVVEKTGYPADMLDLDLDMEADLGVDTVKQAEIFAAIREIYDIPGDENRKLRDYPTLAHVIRFVLEKRPDLGQDASPTIKPEVAIAQAEVPVGVGEPASAAVNEPRVAVASISVTETGSVKERILALVVEKTGYPQDMLDLDLDLEADLGVDTVKQAEMLAAIREIYNIPRDENRKLRDYPTLAHVIRFVLENRPDEKKNAAASPNPTVAVPPIEAVAAQVVEETVTSSVSTPKVDVDAVKDRILELVVEKTGYPKDMLDLDLDLEADLGVDTVKQAEMFAAIREIYNIPRDENRKLRDYPTLAHVIRFVLDNRPDLAGATAQPVVAAAIPTTESPQPSPTKVGSEVRVDVSPHSIRAKVLQIVAEKTGYPPEMLDLDLDLEADLGIDTVKQAEMFAAVRAAYNIPRDESLKLRDFPTLAHVIQFAQKGLEKLPQPAAPTSAADIGNEPIVASAPPIPRVAAPRPPVASFGAANKIPRRVPVPNLRPRLAICKPTGVTLDAKSRVVIASDAGKVADVLADQLKAKGVEVLGIEPEGASESILAELESWLASGSIQGVYWLPALDDEGALANLDLADWREKLRVRVKALYAVMRELYGQVAGSGTFLVSATRLGGHHGYDEGGAASPMGGAVTGFTKTYKRERPDALVKSVDFGAEDGPAEIAKLLIDETLRDPGAVEIGYKNGLRWAVGLQEQPAADGQPGLELNEKSLFLVTGAAGSIVSAITADLASASGGTFYLLDLVPKPDANNPDLARFTNDKDNLKRDLFVRIQARGERATPALVEKELAALERSQAALSAIHAVQAAGGTAHYFSVNLADPDAIAKVIDHVREHYRRIDVLLHAAGLERSHFLPDKDQREFDLVFDVKADGWFNLLHAIGDMPLGATVAFSSVAGRFGNGGQVDYSAANDLLCKYTSSFRTTRPQTRGIVIDWTAWGGIGMATRGSIPKMMELAGIDMLPPEAGIPLIRRELTLGGSRGEVVVGQRLGVMMNEWDATGGLDTAALAASSEKLMAQGPMVGRITGMSVHHGLTMETTLDPAAQPFLYDHRIDGTAVLPGVMGIEAFAEAAMCMHPGWHIEAIEEVNFLAPFKFYKDEPRTVTIEAVIHPQGENLVADCRLIGKRKLPNQEQPQETLHFTGRVRVSKQATRAVSAGAPKLSAETMVQAAQIYRIYFHGPAYQVLDRAWWDGTRMIGEMATGLPGNHKPADLPTLMAPRLIELCFQTAGIWEMGTRSRMGLPQHLQEVTWLRAPQSAEGRLYAVVMPHPEQGTFDAEVVDSQGNCYVRVGGYSTVALPDGLDAESLKSMRSVVLQEPVAVH